MDALGRPSNASGAADLTEHFRGRDLVFVGENDRKPDGSWPGRDGAMKLALELASFLGRPVRVAMPPEGG